MRYLCLLYDDEAAGAELWEKEGDQIMAEYYTFTDEIRKSGHYKGGEALQPVATATTVRVRKGKLQTTDGPFAETKEQLGGYYLIDATDLNEAIRIAARIPACRTGCVEIRPIMELPPQE